VVPNKRIEDILRLAEVYKRSIDAFYRFVFVGRADGMPRYYAAVRALAARFKMLPERFLFVGAVTDWELAAYYRTASVYLSLSEHEGFAVPLLEAMAACVPVFAYDSSAISETLGGAGVCWSPKDLEFAAELLGQVAFDRDLREKVIARQLARLDDFSEARFVDRLQSVVQFAENHQ
jgi:glycosyltransferase involved in cell wall biosynthesis